MKRPAVWPTIKDVYLRCINDEVPALGAQMTYYLILAFFPFVIFLITLTTYTPLSREDVIADLISVIPQSSVGLVQGILDEILKDSNTTLLSFGMIGTLWAASNGMMAIIRTLNKAYEEKEHRSYWKVRGISVLYTIGLSIVIWFAFVLIVFGTRLGELLLELVRLPDSFEQVWSAVKYGLSLTMMCMVFVLLYRFAPSRKLRFSSVLPGALLATVGWVSTSLLFTFYVNTFASYSRIYGSLGGIIALLVWLYLSSVIILLGGELNASLTFRREGRARSGVPPAELARRQSVR